MTVRQVLNDLGYQVDSVSLGKASIVEDLTEEERAGIGKQLRDKGFELISDRDDELLEEIKVQLLSYLRYLEDNDNPQKLSSYLKQKMHYNYSYLSNYFSEHCGITIEKYLINLKIERVKELLTYGELTLSEIAWKLNYSSVQYLSNQFKKTTSMSPTEFKKTSGATRKTFDAI